MLVANSGPLRGGSGPDFAEHSMSRARHLLSQQLNSASNLQGRPYAISTTIFNPPQLGPAAVLSRLTPIAPRDWTFSSRQYVSNCRFGRSTRTALKNQRLLTSPIDQARLLPSMARHLCLSTSSNPLDPARCYSSLPRSPRLTHRCPPHGQAQANLRPFNRLRRLRCGNRLRRAAHHWTQEVAKDLLPTQHTTG